MADFLIPEVDDELIAALARRAAANDTSVEEEARIVLTASAGLDGDTPASDRGD